MKGEKPGATVYARFSDPEAGNSNERPVYFASQFYGAGQVFYIGSGEMWRLRALTRRTSKCCTRSLIRHVSQGRILRGSAAGRCSWSAIGTNWAKRSSLRARLSDAQHEPLDDESVTAQLLRPDGTTEPVKLSAEMDRPGMYAGQATVLQEGTYQLALTLPDGSEEPLNQLPAGSRARSRRTHAERNETLLASLAKETGGMYYDAIRYGHSRRRDSSTAEPSD